MGPDFPRPEATQFSALPAMWLLLETVSPNSSRSIDIFNNNNNKLVLLLQYSVVNTTGIVNIVGVPWLFLYIGVLLEGVLRMKVLPFGSFVGPLIFLRIPPCARVFIMVW